MRRAPGSTSTQIAATSGSDFAVRRIDHQAAAVDGPLDGGDLTDDPPLCILHFAADEIVTIKRARGQCSERLRGYL